MARTLACDLLASSQPPQLLGHSCFLCVYSARTVIRGGKAHCCILTNPRLGPEHSWVLCVGTNAFARPDSPVFTPYQSAPSARPASQTTRPLCAQPHSGYDAHSCTLTPPGLASCSAAPTLLPPYQTVPWLNPSVLYCHFATNSVRVLSGQFRFHSITKT